MLESTNAGFPELGILIDLMGLLFELILQIVHPFCFGLLSVEPPQVDGNLIVSVDFVQLLFKVSFDRPLVELFIPLQI